MTASFTDTEKNILQGQAAKVALKHNCSKAYVNMIIRGEREINSDLGKDIHTDLMALIKLLSPNPPKDDNKNV